MRSLNESLTRALSNATLHLNKIDCRKCDIKINAAKSQVICMRNASGKCARYVVPESKILKLSLNGVEIPFKSSIKYFGLNFDKLMKINNHGRILLTKAKRIIGMFYSLFYRPHLHQNTKLLLYKVAIRSALIY